MLWGWEPWGRSRGRGTLPMTSIWPGPGCASRLPVFPKALVASDLGWRSFLLPLHLKFHPKLVERFQFSMCSGESTVSISPLKTPQSTRRRIRVPAAPYNQTRRHLPPETQYRGGCKDRQGQRGPGGFRGSPSCGPGRPQAQPPFQGAAGPMRNAVIACLQQGQQPGQQQALWGAVWHEVSKCRDGRT